MTRQARPGGRSARTITAVREATLALLAERGFADVEIPDIAERAGVNRTTIYRRWPTKEKLVLAIMLEETREKVPVPDTGSFQGDLTALLKSIAAILMQPTMPALFQALTGLQKGTLGGDDSDYAAMRNLFWEERFTTSGEIVRRAIKRGEIDVGSSPSPNLSKEIIEMGSAPLFFRIIALGKQVTAVEIEAIAARVTRMVEIDSRVF